VTFNVWHPGVNCEPNDDSGDLKKQPGKVLNKEFKAPAGQITS
jgi:hypothetical protein